MHLEIYSTICFSHLLRLYLNAQHSCLTLRNMMIPSGSLIHQSHTSEYESMDVGLEGRRDGPNVGQRKRLIKSECVR